MRKVLTLLAGITLLAAAAAPAHAATSWVGTRFVHVPTVGGAAVGVIGAAAALTGYEAIGCRTFGFDPLHICVRHSWRDPSWRGPVR